MTKRTKNGRKPVLRKPRRFNLDVEQSLLDALRDRAAEEGTDMSRLARKLLAAGLGLPVTGAPASR
jgi:predicted DNA binding CopG/RHH family protein